jgi:hypothetical protein
MTQSLQGHLTATALGTLSLESEMMFSVTSLPIHSVC